MAVAGGGLVGATLALALARAGLEVAVVDAGAPADPRWSAVGAAAFRAWELLGVEGMAARSQPVTAFVTAEGPRPGASAAPWALAASLQFDGPEGEGPLAWMVENRAARGALDRALAEAGVTVLAPARVAGLDVGAREAVLRLEDGTALAAPLVVGAEGRRSRVREAAGIATAVSPYGRSGLAATVRLGRAHGGAARQLFLPDGPLAVLPLPDDRASLVWTTGPAEAAALAALPDAAFLALLNRRLGDALGPATAVEGPRAAFPLERRLAERMTAPRVALAGDAAHVIHPVAGQGLNLGLKDAFALAEVVVDARRRGEDFGLETVLDRYARWRRFDRATVAAGADLFARGWSTDAAPVRLARTAVAGAVAASAPLRAMFAAEAAGRAGEAPRLLRGEAL